MFFQEFLAKGLLVKAGLPIPRGHIATSPEEAYAAALEIAEGRSNRTGAAEPGAANHVVVKAQVPSGRRGKSGGILLASTPAEARQAAASLLGSTLGGYPVEKVLIEEQVGIRRELYAAILTDPASRSALVLFSTEGGMEIEEIHAASPSKIVQRPVDIRVGFGLEQARAMLAGCDLDAALHQPVADVLAEMYRLYRGIDAELVEINPLVVDGAGALSVLDCKLSMDDGAHDRHPELVAMVEANTPPSGTALERKGRELGLVYIELDGDVGVLANGAGLTMATMDVIAHYGGRPANFLEIGGEAYTRAKPALELVLNNPKVKSLLINFCGAFARTDVMTAGVVEALEELKPDVPIFFSIHGTGEEEAIRLVRERLRMEPYEVMEDAAHAAIHAAARHTQPHLVRA